MYYKIDANSLGEKLRAALFPNFRRTESTEQEKPQNKKRPGAGRQLLIPLLRLLK